MPLFLASTAIMPGPSGPTVLQDDPMAFKFFQFQVGIDGSSVLRPRSVV